MDGAVHSPVLQVLHTQAYQTGRMAEWNLSRHPSCVQDVQGARGKSRNIAGR